MLFEALGGRSSEVRDDEAGLRKEREGRAEGEIAPDIIVLSIGLCTLFFETLLSSKLEFRLDTEWKAKGLRTLTS